MRKAICLPPVRITGEDLAPWIGWNLWKARNSLLFNDKSRSHTELILKAITDCKDWRSAQSVLTPKAQPKVTPRFKRKVGTVTVRSDATWKEDTKIAGLGWCFFQN